LNEIEYNAFTEKLSENLKGHENVLGLIALGSMSATDYMPDRYSDHDFFVVVKKGFEGWYKTTREWLPDFQNIVLHYKETEHGVKVVYQNGHLLEFAIFTLEELYVSRINRYRVIFERTSLERILQEIVIRTQSQAKNENSSIEFLTGQFITNTLVGVGRYKRGEEMSGHKFVKFYALNHLLILIESKIASDTQSLLDNLDPFRRLERVYPEIADKLNQALLLDVPKCAESLLNLYTSLFEKMGEEFQLKAVSVVLEFIKETK